MSYFFTNLFREALFDNPALMDAAQIQVRLFRTAPSLTSAAASQWLQASTTDELLEFIGWEEVTGIGGYPDDMGRVTVSVRQSGANNYVLFTAGYPFDPGIDQAVRVEGFAIEFVGTLSGVTNPLIFVTNTPIGTFTNLDPRDVLAANPDITLGAAAASRWMFAWADPAPEATSVNPIEGPLTLLRAPSTFEASNTIHVWLYPQRANMIANPSFEYDNSQWAPLPTRLREAAFQPVLAGTVANEDALMALTPVVGSFYVTTDDDHVWEYLGPDPNDNPFKWKDHGLPMGGGWCGHFVGTGPKMAVESNVWETRQGYDDHELWTFQLMAQGTGRLKVGLVSWDLDYRATNVDWGTEVWDLVPGAWVHVTCVRYGPQAHTAMMRLEVVSGTDEQDLKIDRVLAERGPLKEYPYFDGDEHYGLIDDYSWYGGSARRGVSYSMWYGGRRAVVGRLFAVPTDTDAPGDLVTDVDVMAAGMVYDWVPAGVTVIPHMDVFYPTDLKGPLPPRRPTVLPPVGPDDPLGVEDPWTPEELPPAPTPPQTWTGSIASVGVAGISGDMTTPDNIPVFLNVASAAGTNAALSSTVTGQTIVLAIACVTRLNAAESTGFWSTVDRYSGGSTGHDGIGQTPGAGLNEGQFGTRSHIEVRQDFLNFLDGDEWAVGLNAADHAQSAAFYRCPYPWKVRQIANATTATTALSATFAAPVAAGSRVVIAIACLSANSVTTPPANGALDGSSAETSQRTSRITSYRLSTAMVGQTNRTATMASATGGAAMVMIEVAQEDVWEHDLSDAIRGMSDLMAYYPMNSSLGNGEKNTSPVATLGPLTQGGWSYYDQAAPDGRKYWRHAAGANPANNGDHDELTPWGHSGMTVGFMMRLDSLATLQTIVGKNENASNFAKEWEVYVDTNGALTARTCINFAVPPISARQRTTAAGVIAVNVWYLVIVRFGNDANDFPTIRINGIQHAGTTTGTSAANANSTAISTVGAAYLNSSSRALLGAIGHVFYNTIDISDASAAALELAAQGDSWYVLPQVTINRQLPDPTTLSPVKFDVLFSESVSGFTAADITLSGTAPGTLTAVIASTSGLGYVVEVRGMSGTGTVIATIAAGVCTSVATGNLNAASTSTDNSIAYQPTGVTPFFDPFTRPDFINTVDSLGADWSQVDASGTLYYGIVSNQMTRPGTGANNAQTHVAKPQHILPGPDITVEFDMVANPGIFINLYVYSRYDFATNTGYRLTFNNNGGGGPNLFCDLEKIISGVPTSIGSVTLTNLGSGGSTPFYPGRWRWACIGSTITVHSLPSIGGATTLRLTRTDASIAIGAGVGFQGYSNTNANVQIIDNVSIT